MPSPIMEMPSNLLIRRVLVWQPLGLMLMAFHVLLVRESIWLLPVVPVLLGWLYWHAPLAGVLVYFQILIYQNLLISVFSVGMDYTPTFVVLEGTNFAVLCLMAVLALNRLLMPRWWRQTGSTVTVVLLALGMLMVYLLLGVSKAGATSALVYFREFAAPLFAVLVGLDLGRVWGYKTVGSGFMFSATLAICLGLIEYSIPLDYYAWMHEVSFYQLKFTMQPAGNAFFVPGDIVDHFTDTFLDLSGNSPTASTLTTFRFGGSVITPTSFAYILAVVGLVAISLRRSGWLVILLPMLFLIGAKGAALLLILSVLLWTVWQVTRHRPMLLISGVVLAVAYVSFGIVRGLETGDYHVIGFLGGVHSLLTDPLGHGLGVGGNLSADANILNSRNGFKLLGSSFALESAIGVLFYQTGIASIVLLGVFLLLVGMAPLGEHRNGRIVPTRQDIMVIAVAVIMVNGVYQEEAYSPYAAGSVLLLCGCIIGNSRRPVEIAWPMVRRFSQRAPI